MYLYAPLLRLPAPAPASAGEAVPAGVGNTLNVKLPRTIVAAVEEIIPLAVTVVAVATPSAGVTKVGEVFITKVEPEPV